MRWLLALTFLCPLVIRAEDSTPIEVLIIGVPSTRVAFYRNSPLGTESVNVCHQLKDFFKSTKVHITSLCTVTETTYSNVNAKLNAYFGGPSRHRVTLLFLMSHGEKTLDGDDVRLLMSDTTDANLADHSILLGKDLGGMLKEARASAAIGFVDACFSGAAANLDAVNIEGEKRGVHAGLLASSQAYQESSNLSFTKALIETWQTDCPANDDDFISAVLNRMPRGGSSPTWLIKYDGGACFGDVTAADKQVLSIWRDPSEQIRVSLFDENHDGSKSIYTIPPGPAQVMPYLRVVPPGIYKVETYSDRDPTQVFDTQTCDVSGPKLSYCKYFYPASQSASVLPSNLERIADVMASLDADPGVMDRIHQKTMEAFEANQDFKDADRVARLMGLPQPPSGLQVRIADVPQSAETSPHSPAIIPVRAKLAKQSTVTATFDYDFGRTRACSTNIKRRCIKEFNVYKINQLYVRTKIFSIAAPAGETAFKKGLSGTSLPLYLTEKKYKFAVTAVDENGDESGLNESSKWIEIMRQVFCWPFCSI